MTASGTYLNCQKEILDLRKDWQSRWPETTKVPMLFDWWVSFGTKPSVVEGFLLSGIANLLEVNLVVKDHLTITRDPEVVVDQNLPVGKNALLFL